MNELGMETEDKKTIRAFAVSLTVTEQCNLDCSYCFVVNKSSREMPLGIALKTVERYLNKAIDGFNQITIEFSGGEPLLCFPLIRQVVDHVISRPWHNPFSFSIGTNGTLITDEVRAWADEHPCVSFALSLDGTEEIQNLNRSNSYSAVMKNLDFFRKWPDSKIKMTIGPESIDHTAACVKHIHELGFELAANLVFEDVWGRGEEKEKYLKIFDRQLRELVGFYMDNQELTPPYLVNFGLEKILRPLEGKIRFCGSGKNMVTIDVDGNEYPCHRFMPMASANPCGRPDFEFKQVKPAQCENCVLVAACPSCLAYNHECHSNVDHRTTHHCEFIKLQAMATAKLQYHKLKHEIQDNPPESCDQETGERIRRKIESIRYLMENIQL